MARKFDRKKDEFVFVPLGGVGEIGMNLYLYGYGRRGACQWLIVDMGVTFGTEAEPGILYGEGFCKLVWIEHAANRSVPVPPGLRALLAPPV